MANGGCLEGAAVALASGELVGRGGGAGEVNSGERMLAGGDCMAGG